MELIHPTTELLVFTRPKDYGVLYPDVSLNYPYFESVVRPLMGGTGIFERRGLEVRL